MYMESRTHLLYVCLSIYRGIKCMFQTPLYSFFCQKRGWGGDLSRFFFGSIIHSIGILIKEPKFHFVSQTLGLKNGGGGGFCGRF